MEQIYPVVEQHAEMLRGERAEHGEHRIERGAGEHECGRVPRIEEADIGADQPPDEIDRGKDRVDAKAQREAVWVAAEAVIGVGQQRESALGQEIDAEPREPNDGRPVFGLGSPAASYSVIASLLPPRKAVAAKLIR